MSAPAKKPAKEKPAPAKGGNDQPAEDSAAAAKKPGGDLAGKFGAWWNGKEYVPGAPAEDGANDKAEKPKKAEKPAKEEKAEKPEAKAEAKPEPKPEPKPETKPEPAVETPAPAAEVSADVQEMGAAVRVKALETLWGEGRLAPGAADLDAKLLDAALENADRMGGIGFIGADAALLNAFAARSDRPAHATEWRNGALGRVKELAPRASIELCDLDRPRGFGDNALDAVVSCEAFAFADHKNGLVARVHRSLNATGRWVFVDTTRNTSKTPAQAFASAWAEPQLSTNDDIEEILKLAGFPSVYRISVTELVLNAARAGYQQLAGVLENAAKTGMSGREGALYLQELAWEAQSWRARVRALEGGALEVNLWVADKETTLELTQPAGLTDDVLDLELKPDDAGASDALFEPS